MRYPKKSDSDGSYDLKTAGLQQREEQNISKRQATTTQRSGARVAVEALKGERTVAALATAHVHPTMIHQPSEP